MSKNTSFLVQSLARDFFLSLYVCENAPIQYYSKPSVSRSRSQNGVSTPNLAVILQMTICWSFNSASWIVVTVVADAQLSVFYYADTLGVLT